MKVSRIFSLLLFVLSLVFFFLYLRVPEPKWKFWVLDTEHPRRFVSLTTDSNGNPHIFYFNERDGGGLLYITSKSSGNNFLDDLNYFFKGREWIYEVVDGRKNVGFFVSSIFQNNKLHVTYQDSTLGREKLLYATKNGEWKIEIVDKVEESGINVGMYASISFQKRPVIFYHVEEGRKLMCAIKNNNWVKRELDRGVGWFISSEACENKIFLVYRERDGKNIYFAKIEDGRFSSKKLNANTSSQLSITTKNCEPYIAYFDEDKGKIYFSSLVNFSPIEVGKGKLSRISLYFEQGFHLVYGVSGDGLYYAFSENGRNWNLTILDKGIREGEYNSLKVDERGNIHVAYLNRTALKYAEYNVSSVRGVRILLLSFTTIFASGFLILSIKSKRRK